MEMTFKTLRKCSLFRDLDEKAFDVLLPLLEEVEFEKEQNVFDEGGQGRALYFIAQGMVRLRRKGRFDSDIALVDLKEGEVFGEMSLISEAPRSASAVTRLPTVLWKLPAEKFASLEEGSIDVYTTVLHNLNSVMCWRLTNATTKAVRALEDVIQAEANNTQMEQRLKQNQSGLEGLLSTLRESGRRIFDSLGI